MKPLKVIFSFGRGADFSPRIHFTHGPWVSDQTVASSMPDVVTWAQSHPDEMVVVIISHCEVCKHKTPSREGGIAPVKKKKRKTYKKLFLFFLFSSFFSGVWGFLIFPSPQEAREPGCFLFFSPCTCPHLRNECKSESSNPDASCTYSQFKSAYEAVGMKVQFDCSTLNTWMLSQPAV